jgi:uncharacterized protein YciI
VAGASPDDALTEEHWSYMDRFAEGMVARGPTLGRDRERWTGSMHVVDLPDADAARRFAEDEPYNRAGLFEEHLIRRFVNRLGRTMWEYAGEPGNRYLVIAERSLDSAAARHAERVIVHGDLLSTDGRPAGAVLALVAPSSAALEGLGEVLDWEPGGRR